MMTGPLLTVVVDWKDTVWLAALQRNGVPPRPLMAAGKLPPAGHACVPDDGITGSG
jgi:hypothetical protein